MVFKYSENSAISTARSLKLLQNTTIGNNLERGKNDFAYTVALLTLTHKNPHRAAAYPPTAQPESIKISLRIK